MGVARRLGAVLLLLGALTGCATTSSNPADPLEPFNRAMFSFNDTVDTAVFKPVAEGYRAVLPSFVRTGVSNFFGNLEDIWIAANNLMQGKVTDAVGDTARFIFNSTFGMLGLIDISSDIGLAKHNEDFGQTLGRWGLGSGPYLVLPLLGPSTVRDGAGLLLDVQADLVTQTSHVPTRNTAYAIRAVNTRANLLDTTSVVEQAALDKYSFVRDAWLQRRRNLVYDGNPPPEQRGQAESPDSDSDSAAAPAPGVTGAGHSRVSGESVEQSAERTGQSADLSLIHAAAPE
jgi:phospholipid-binding lipoprotein MlaA